MKLADMLKYAEEFNGSTPDLLNEVAEMTGKSLKYDDMLSGPVVAGLLRFLIQVSGAVRVLELGMFTGYSTLAMALALPDNGRVTSCENNLKYINLAKSVFAKSGVEHKIDIKYGDALKTLDQIRTSFDLIFIDADKENYLAYYEKCVPLLKNGGILVVDNAWLAGKVREPANRKGKVVHGLNTALQGNKFLVNVMLPFRDGIHLAVKKTKLEQVD
ncbi:MAG: O-methyltransferase [Cyclonatronaceae bacterium]